ncbi:MAG TPA: type III-A CRISPR-associated RAMP protein Csm5, partial [Methanosarcina sp.]|nr:type III-A CRISPR-associated RAMP protein Csm5 [Methanosarcina sp.]
MIDAMISKIIELETLTPLFIKGKDLDYGEGMLRGSDGVVYLIDNDKLCEYIYDKKKIEEYVHEFDGRNKKPRLKDFLNRNAIYPNDSELRKISKGITEISEKVRQDDEEQKTNFIQNGKKKPFIPGTSLKGAIRNAVLWKFLQDKKNKFLFDDFFSSQRVSLDNEIQGIALISEALDKAEHEEFACADKVMEVFLKSPFQKKFLFERAKSKDGLFVYYGNYNSIDKKLQDYQKSFAKYFSKNTFQNKRSILNILHLEQIPQATKDFGYISMNDFNLRWQSAKRNKSLVDFFRLVKISDGNIIQDISLDWLHAKTVCKDNAGQTYKKDHTNTLECVPKAVKAHFKITIDKKLAKDFFPPNKVPSYLQSIEELLKVVNEFFRAVALFENTKFYSEAKPIPNITKGKEKVDTSQVEQLYKSTFGLSPNEILFRTGWGGGFISKTQFLHMSMDDRVRVRDMVHYNGSSLAPKSRCLIIEGQSATEPLGWCKLRVLGDTINLALPSIDVAKISTDFLTEQPRQIGQQYRQGSRQNQERPVTEKEIQKSKAEATTILKLVEKQKKFTTQVTYMKGQVVLAKVDECKPFESIKITIGNQSVCIIGG